MSGHSSASTMIGSEESRLPPGPSILDGWVYIFGQRTLSFPFHSFFIFFLFFLLASIVIHV
jgi:hypothetical protein